MEKRKNQNIDKRFSNDISSLRFLRMMFFFFLLKVQHRGKKINKEITIVGEEREREREREIHVRTEIYARVVATKS